MPWLTRAFFSIVVALAIAGLVGGVGCTRRGKPSTIPPTASPLTTIAVNPATGSDSTGDGTTAKPYKTLTKAVTVVKNSTTPGLTIQLAAGTYDAATGEVFPIVLPTGMAIVGTGYNGGRLPTAGSFINGFGEDLAFEKLAGRPSSKTAFATLEVASTVTSPISISSVYVGAARLALPANASYASMDALGALSASHASFAAGMPLARPRIAGILLPSGTLNCTACKILGSDYAILAFTIPNGLEPSVFLSGQPTQGTIGGKIGIATDGSVGVNSAYQTFQSKQYGYRDSVVPVTSPIPLSPGVDFGHGPEQSAGGNIFIGPKGGTAEISVTVPQTVVFALGNIWNPLTQGTDAHGLYPRARTFRTGDRGRNVTVEANAGGATVLVGPIPTTPVPSSSPTGGPTPTGSPT